MISLDAGTAQAVRDGRCSCLLTHDGREGHDFSDVMHAVYCEKRYVCDVQIRSVTRLPGQATMPWWIALARNCGLSSVDELHEYVARYMSDTGCRYGELMFYTVRVV